MIKNTILGTPITPAAHIEQLKGRSFCVSFAARDSHLGNVGDGRQLDAIIDAQDPDGMLLVDNGAFSAFTQDIEIDWLTFEPWAAAIANACPAAIIVLPDVIKGGTEQLNDELIRETWGGLAMEHGIDQDRMMVVWHLHESLDRLERLVEEGWQWIAFGSSGDYWDPKAQNWRDRIDAAFARLDEVCAPESGNRRPHIHMMRAQLQHQKHDFDSSDSTNVARNHSRHKGPTNHVAVFADGISAKIAATADGEQRIETPAEVHEILDDIAQLLPQYADRRIAA